jgi:hypothetical protein
LVEVPQDSRDNCVGVPRSSLRIFHLYGFDRIFHISQFDQDSGLLGEVEASKISTSVEAVGAVDVVHRDPQLALVFASVMYCHNVGMP